MTKILMYLRSQISHSLSAPHAVAVQNAPVISWLKLSIAAAAEVIEEIKQPRDCYWNIIRNLQRVKLAPLPEAMLKTHSRDGKQRSPMHRVGGARAAMTEVCQAPMLPVSFLVHMPSFTHTDWASWLREETLRNFSFVHRCD